MSLRSIKFQSRSFVTARHFNIAQPISDYVIEMKSIILYYSESVYLRGKKLRIDAIIGQE